MSSPNRPTKEDMLQNVGHLVKSMHDSQTNAIYSKTIQRLKSFDKFYHGCEEEDWRKKIGDKIAKSELGWGGFIVKYLNYLTHDGKKYPLQEETKFKCYDELRRLCWDYTKDSTTLCETLGRNGIISVLLDDLKDFQNTYTTSKEKRTIVRSAIGILHNCSVVRDNVKYFKEAGGSQLIKWYAEKAKTDLKDGLGISFIMTYCNVFDDDNNKIITTDEAMLRILLELLEEALENDNHVTTTYHEYHAIDILNSLSHLASNEKISEILVRDGILQKIYRMLSYGNEKEQVAAAGTAWQLAFTDQNKAAMLGDHRLMQLLEQLSSTEPNEDASDLQKKAGNAIWVLKKLNKEKKQSRTTGGHVMISYQWSSQEIARQPTVARIETAIDTCFSHEAGLISIAPSTPTTDVRLLTYQSAGSQVEKFNKLVEEELKSKDYDTWIDVEKMTGEILSCMADAVEKASVVIVCLSQKYKDSKNCRTEGHYAYQLGKPVIPILVEDKYKADGWLGALIGTKLYFNLSSKEKFQDNISGFLKELDTIGKAAGMKNPENKDSSESVPSPSEWTIEEVTKWLQQNGIEKLKEDDVDGESLMFLKDIKRKSPEFFFRYVTEDLGLQGLKNIRNFVKAIENIN